MRTEAVRQVGRGLRAAVRSRCRPRALTRRSALRFEFPQVPLRGNTRQYAGEGPIPCRVLPRIQFSCRVKPRNVTSSTLNFFPNFIMRDYAGISGIKREAADFRPA
jgi:hypothetical protein